MPQPDMVTTEISVRSSRTVLNIRVGLFSRGMSHNTKV
jgi:hypothetical protein